MSDALKDELLERFESDLEFLADTVQLYKEDSPQLIFQMRTDFTRQYSATLVDAAYTLKEQLSNRSAHQAVEAALKLVTMNNRRRLSNAENAIAVLENKRGRVKVALVEMLRQG